MSGAVPQRRERRLAWPLVVSVVILAVSMAVIVLNYMPILEFRNWLLFAGLGVQAVGWLGLVVGLVLFLTVKRPVGG